MSTLADCCAARVFHLCAGSKENHTTLGHVSFVVVARRLRRIFPFGEHFVTTECFQCLKHRRDQLRQFGTGGMMSWKARCHPVIGAIGSIEARTASPALSRYGNCSTLYSRGLTFINECLVYVEKRLRSRCHRESQKKPAMRALTTSGVSIQVSLICIYSTSSQSSSRYVFRRDERSPIAPAKIAASVSKCALHILLARRTQWRRTKSKWQHYFVPAVQFCSLFPIIFLLPQVVLPSTQHFLSSSVWLWLTSGSCELNELHQIRLVRAMKHTNSYASVWHQLRGIQKQGEKIHSKLFAKYFTRIFGERARARSPHIGCTRKRIWVVICNGFNSGPLLLLLLLSFARLHYTAAHYILFLRMLQNTLHPADEAGGRRAVLRQPRRWYRLKTFYIFSIRFRASATQLYARMKRESKRFP